MIESICVGLVSLALGFWLGHKHAGRRRRAASERMLTEYAKQVSKLTPEELEADAKAPYENLDSGTEVSDAKSQGSRR